MKKLILFLFLSSVISHWSFATVRYVSHSGTDTPPYLTWETAADSIMSAINISSFGDTIYVANGVYEEQVVMIPGLSLIGAGMDSCVIDTRNLVTGQTFISVGVADSCHLTGFQIMTYSNSYWGYAIGALEGNSISWINSNKVTGGRYGVFINNQDTSNHSKIQIINNVFSNISQGVHLFTTNAMVKNNFIYTDPNSQAVIVAGVSIEAYFFNFYPVIDSNYIESVSFGIYKSYGARPIIKNNSIILKGVGGDGIDLGITDSVWVYNNLVYAESGMEGIYPSGVQYLFLYNNYFTGNFDDQQNLKYVVSLGPGHTAINNVITNAKRGVKVFGTQNLVFKHNNVWNNEIDYNGLNPDTTNLSVDPMIVNDDSIQGELVFHLQMFSPLIDRGDPDILDKDGTRSDIGLCGGPHGESYKYLDLPPRIPINLSATIDSIHILLKWNKNTEADFSHYNLFRDTTENFTVDSTTFVASIPDTFYQQIIPQGIDNLYFKLTAVDNQGNQSDPSEELHVLLTGINNKKQITISNYQLYQNYPNPFNPTTKISYRLKERGYVKLYIYDIKGELVETIVNKYQEGGYYEVEFSTAESGNPKSGIHDLASGIYIYQIMVRNDNNIPVFLDIKKMVYIK